MAALNPAKPVGSLAAQNAGKQLWIIVPNGTGTATPVLIAQEEMSRKLNPISKTYEAVNADGLTVATFSQVTALGQTKYTVKTPALQIPTSGGYTPSGASEVTAGLLWGLELIANMCDVVSPYNFAVFVVMDPARKGGTASIAGATSAAYTGEAFLGSVVNVQTIEGKISELASINFEIDVQGTPIPWTAGATIFGVSYVALVNPAD